MVFRFWGLSTARFFLCATLLCATCCMQAQSPYQLSWKKEAALVVPTGALLGASFLLKARLEPLSVAQINLLNRNTVPRFDRIATYQYGHKAGKWSDYLFETSLLFPILLLADAPIRKDVWKVGIITTETLLISSTLTALTKVLAKRVRPFVYNPDATLGEKQNKDARYSFFSGHTSGTACLSVVAAKIWSDYHPDSRWKPLIWTTALAWPAAVGILRVKAGKHFPTDVLVGYAVGFACGYFLPKLHFQH